MYLQNFNFKIRQEKIGDLFKEILVDILGYHPIDAANWLTHFQSNKNADLRPSLDDYFERIAATYQPAAHPAMQYCLWYHIGIEDGFVGISIDDNGFTPNLNSLLTHENPPPSAEQLKAVNNCVGTFIKEIAIATEKVIDKYKPVYKTNSLKQ